MKTLRSESQTNHRDIVFRIPKCQPHPLTLLLTSFTSSLQSKNILRTWLVRNQASIRKVPLVGMAGAPSFTPSLTPAFSLPAAKWARVYSTAANFLTLWVWAEGRKNVTGCRCELGRWSFLTGLLYQLWSHSRDQAKSINGSFGLVISGPGWWAVSPTSTWFLTRPKIPINISALLVVP